MDVFFIRPACPGADIRDPETGDRLPVAGDSKPRTPHWLALEIRGDVVEGPLPAGETEPAPEPEPGPAPDAWLPADEPN